MIRLRFIVNISLIISSKYAYDKMYVVLSKNLPMFKGYQAELSIPVQTCNIN
jgi:hypothetical protein